MVIFRVTSSRHKADRQTLAICEYNWKCNSANLTPSSPTWRSARPACSGHYSFSIASFSILATSVEARIFSASASLQSVVKEG